MPTDLPPQPLSAEARSDIELAGIDPELVEPDSVQYRWPSWAPDGSPSVSIHFAYTPSDGRRRRASIEFVPPRGQDPLGP